MSVKVTTPSGEHLPNAIPDGRQLVFFDIDNCLYSKDSGIAEMMGEKIRDYFKRIGLPEDEAVRLHHHYYTEYGLAIRGLVQHHQVDPLDYDAQCDAALPLESVLRPDAALKSMLNDIDRSKYRVWALTNAYVNHAVRVLRLLELGEYFEGVVSCDYGAKDFSCKPEADFFQQALTAAGLKTAEKAYFVDDSAINIKGSNALGWGHCVLFDEFGNESERLGGLEKLEGKAKVSVIDNMQQLRSVWKEIFVHRE